MKQTGITDRLEHKFLEEHNTQVQDKTQTVLSYEDVMFPFLALLIGILIALGQLGIETAFMCKKKCTDDGEQSKKYEIMSQKAEEIIDDIHVLLKANHGELGGIKFLTKMRMLSSLQDATSK